MMIHKKVLKIGNGTELAWEKICFRLGPSCMINGLLELWSFNETVINQLSKDDILKKINQPEIISPVTNKKFVLSQYIGGIERNGTKHIVKAEASITAYGIKYNPVLNTAEGRLVSIYSHSFLNINTQTL
ncbi:uncharacterized protein [Porites lutea]|uniref:uncharacterized protein n=1 Tax=Porites lutea TaxID=51062 RepID=UPI003CC6B21B